MLNSSFGSTEILQIADAVAREKGIDKASILTAMEESIAVAARKKYGYGRNLHAEIDHKTGSVKLYRELHVVDDEYLEQLSQMQQEEEDEGGGDHVMRQDNSYISIEEARLKKEDAEVGDVLREPLPPIDLGRVAAQTAKQVIIQKVREAERERQFEDFKDRVGEVLNGTVKRVEFGDVMVDLGRAEAVIKHHDQIRGESFKVNDRIRALLKDVKREVKGAQLFLSRTAPEFMEKLFEQEVPEVYDGIIVIKSVAREPGARAKISVYSSDHNIDPVGSCVGVRGSRVQAVINELQGEKIDIIEWSQDPVTYVIRALAPAEVSKVIIDEDNDRIEVVVPDDQLSLAIGRRGQNVRLATDLTGWKIDICTEEEESTRRSEEFNQATNIFVEALNVEEIIAQLLATEGYSSIEDIIDAEIEEISSIEGFNEDIAEEIQGRAREFIETKQEEVQEKIKALGVDASLADFEGLSGEFVIKLAEKGIKTLDDFADLSHVELVELVPDSGMSDQDIDAFIMKAREHWFEQDQDSMLEEKESSESGSSKEEKTSAPEKKKVSNKKGSKQDSIVEESTKVDEVKKDAKSIKKKATSKRKKDDLDSSKSTSSTKKKAKKAS